VFGLTGVVLTASFRGRPLEGCKRPLPDGYVGKLFLTIVKQVSEPHAFATNENMSLYCSTV